MIGLDAVWRNSVKCDVWKVLKTSFGMHLSINLDKKLVNVKSGSCPLPSALPSSPWLGAWAGGHPILRHKWPSTRNGQKKSFSTLNQAASAISHINSSLLFRKRTKKSSLAFSDGSVFRGSMRPWSKTGPGQSMKIDDPKSNRSINDNWLINIIVN